MSSWSLPRSIVHLRDCTARRSGTTNYEVIEWYFKQNFPILLASTFRSFAAPFEILLGVNVSQPRCHTDVLSVGMFLMHKQENGTGHAYSTSDLNFFITCSPAFLIFCLVSDSIAYLVFSLFLFYFINHEFKYILIYSPTRISLGRVRN